MLSIAALRRAKIPVPEFAAASNYIELLSVVNKMGFPLVLKPLDNAGSRGVQLISGVSELKNAYEEAMMHSNSSMVLVEKFCKDHKFLQSQSSGVVRYIHLHLQIAITRERISTRPISLKMESTSRVCFQPQNKRQ
jgi:biotin carboxylase